ncbi:MAG TPA: RHS repeat-associated core domain-containing protein [Marmoricola sp.]
MIDADGVVEAENTYDEWGRVVRQRSPHGRTTRFVYLPGQITVVSDENGERSNTWIADDAGRLVGVVDADEQRASFAYDAHGSPVLATERDGSTTVTEYDQRGRKIRQVLPSGADFVYAYDDADRVVRVDVASGGPLDDDDASVSVTAYEYSGDERNPSVVHDPEGGRTEMVWSQGLLQQVVDPTGVVVHFEHDDHGDLVATIDAEGNAARLERDGVGRVTTAITPSGARTGFTYDESNGLLSARIDPDGARWTYEYTTGGRMTAVIDPAGARTVIERDSATGDETRSVDPLGRVVSRSYDDLGNLSEVRLPDGSGWAFTHDALSRVREITNPGGGTVTADYDIVGAPTTISDPTGVRTEISTDPGTGRVVSTDGVASSGAEVDRLGRLVGEVQPDGSTVLTRYDRCGRPVEVVDPSGALTRIERDAGGRVVTQILPSGAEIGHTYDSCGRLTTVTDPTGATTRYVYDADGRVVEQISPTGDVATSRYDECGRLLARRIPGVGTFTYAYDACSRVIESRDPANGRRRFSYDAAGQLVATIDGNGGRTTYDYDLNGRCTTITHPDGGVTRREFDANNRCIAETDPLGRTTTAEYDAAGRQTVQVDPEGRRTEWSYDPRTGLLASMSVDGVEVQQIERDIPGRRVRVTDRANPRGEVTVHELAWDERGQLTSRTRDGRGLSWAYNADGACTSMTTPDGHTTSYARDGAGRILGVSHPLLGDVLLERDAVGRTTSAVATGPDGSRSGSQSWTYAAGFLTTHLQKGPDGSTRTVLDHDDVGRINTISVENPDGSAGRTSYSYDEAGQLLAAQTGESTLRWSYDSCGRLVREIHDSAGQQVSRRFDYDLAGQLRTITVGGQVVSTYTHDGAGRRTSETHADGSRRDYGWSPAGWLASLTQTDRIGDTTRTDIIVDALGELAYINDTEFFSDTAHPYAGLVGTATDPIIGAGPYTGTTAGWSSPGWRDARAVSADPWALPPVPATDAADYQISPTGDLLIGGHQGSDPLEWLTNRVYDAATRSFCSVDPIAATVGAGWAANPYSYAGNDPLHALDPLGLHPVTDAELRAYNANNGGLISGATHWLKNNWEYVAGAAMVIGGGILIATGVGGPAGMMLLSAGADTIIQKATTGHVNWGEVAVSGVLGGIGGGAATWAARASEGGVAALRTSMIVNGAVGATGSETMYVIRNHGHLTVQGMLGAGVAGGVTGAVGGAAGPAGGTIAKNLGATATGPLAKTATGVINFGGGFSGNVAGSLVSGDDVNIVHAAETGGLSTAGGIAGDRFGPPSTGTSTLKQMSYFGTRTVRGVFNAGAHNTQALWGSAGIGTGVGLVGP